MNSVNSWEIFSKGEWEGLVDSLGLSPQQSSIVQHLCAGMSDKQIATEMGISLPTVRTHISRLFMKYGVQDRVHLILFIFKTFRNCCCGEACLRRQ